MAHERRLALVLMHYIDLAAWDADKSDHVHYTDPPVKNCRNTGNSVRGHRNIRAIKRAPTQRCACAVHHIRRAVRYGAKHTEDGASAVWQHRELDCLLAT